MSRPGEYSCTAHPATAGEGYSIRPAVAGTYALAQPKFQQSQLLRAKTVGGCPQYRFQLLGLFLVSPGDWRGGDRGPPHNPSKHNAGQNTLAFTSFSYQATVF